MVINGCVLKLFSKFGMKCVRSPVNRETIRFMISFLAGDIVDVQVWQPIVAKTWGSHGCRGIPGLLRSISAAPDRSSGSTSLRLVFPLIE